MVDFCAERGCGWLISISSTSIHTITLEWLERDNVSGEHYRFGVGKDASQIILVYCVKLVEI